MRLTISIWWSMDVSDGQKKRKIFFLISKIEGYKKVCLAYVVVTDGYPMVVVLRVDFFFLLSFTLFVVISHI